MAWTFDPERLRKARAKKKWTVRELATVAEISYGAVSLIERGERVPNAEIVGRLASALDLEPSDFYVDR